MTYIQMIETVAFRPQTGVSEAELMTAARSLDGYLDRCAGFLSRTLFIDDTGLWHEQYIWANEAAAKAADAGFMAAPEAKTFMALVDRDSVQMGHRPAALYRSAAPVMA